MNTEREGQKRPTTTPRVAAIGRSTPLRATDAISLSADGILAIDGSRRIRIFNPALEQLTGLRKSAVEGRVCSEVLRVTDAYGNPLCSSDCPLHQSQDGTFDVDGEIIAACGTRIPVNLHYSIQHRPSGRLRSAVVNVRNVSGRDHTNYLRSVLLALISHELQTPIAIIKAYASTLARVDATWSDEVVREKLVAIEEESDRLSRMVSRLLYTSRLEASSISLNAMLLDLPLETQRVAKRLAETDDDHEVLVSFSADFPPIMGDPEKIDEVLTNLIENAMKFSPKGGVVTVEGAVVGTEARITVGDQGIGIPQGEMEQIFERFYRVTSPGSNTPGTGLGLHICRLLINAHGGRIWAESHHGVGSRFTFTLPIAGEA